MTPEDPRRESLRKECIFFDGPYGTLAAQWWDLLVEIERERDEARELAESNRNGSMEQELIYRANEIKRVEAERDEARMAAVGGFPKMLAQVNQLQIELDKARAQLERAYHSHGMLSKVEAERDTALRDLAEARVEVKKLNNEITERQYNIWAPLQVQNERLQNSVDELAEALRDLVAAIDAECEASKVWYKSKANSTVWDEAGKNREIAMGEARTALAQLGGGKENP